MKKKLVCLNLALLMVLTLLPIGIARADVPDGEDGADDWDPVTITYHYLGENGEKQKTEETYGFNISVNFADSFYAPERFAPSGKVFLGWNTVDKDNAYGGSTGGSTDPEVTESPEPTEGPEPTESPEPTTSPEVTEDPEETPEIMQAAEVAEDGEVYERWIYGNEPVHELFMNGIHDLYAQYGDIPNDKDYIILYYTYGLSPDGQIRQIVELTADGTVTLPSELYGGQKAIYWFVGRDGRFAYYPCGAEVAASMFTSGETLSAGSKSWSGKYAIIDGDGGTTEAGGPIAVIGYYYSSSGNLIPYGTQPEFTKENSVFIGYKGGITNTIYPLSVDFYCVFDAECSSDNNQIANFTAQYEEVSGPYIHYVGNGAVTANEDEKEYYIQELDPSNSNVLRDSMFTHPYSEWRFLGWTDSLDINSADCQWYQPGDSIDSDVTSMILYAQWGTNKVTYHFSDINDEERSFTYLSSPQIEAYYWYTQENTVFAGWNTQNDGEGTWYAVGTEIEDVEILDLYAQWITIPADSSYYILSTSTGSIDEGGRMAKLVPMEAATATITLPEGDWFCWLVSGSAATSGFVDENEDMHEPGEEITVESGTHLIACDPLMQIDFYKNAGSDNERRAYYNFVSPPNLTVYGAGDVFDSLPSGSTFTGWNTQSNGTGTSYRQGDIISVGVKFALYAQWASAPVTGGPTSSNTTTTTERNPDGSTTTTTTDRTTGTVTETTRHTDGSTSTVETQTNGTVTTTERAANGVETKTVDQPGQNVTAAVTIPSNVASATVTVPARVTPGTVAIDADTGEIIKLSIPTGDGMDIKLDSSANIILVDNSQYFSDVDDINHWAEDSVAFVSSHELFIGTGENTFSPESSTTRAQLMTVLARLDGVSANGSDALDKGMDWAVALGISDGSDPNESISRQQVAVMMWRYAGSPASSYTLNASDAGDVADYAQVALAWAMENGIMNGYPDGSLQPGGPASRAQVAAMVQRFCSTLV